MSSASHLRAGSLLERRTDELLASATSTLLAEPGASMTKVARAAGVSRTTLHARYPSRDDLLRAVAGRALEACERVASDALEHVDAADGGLAHLVAMLVPIGPQLSFLWRNPSFDHDEVLGARWQRIEEHIVEVVARASRVNAIPGGRPAWWDVYTLLALVYVAAESIYLGRLAPLDAPNLVLRTLRGSEESP
jgi:AcrR family transcriptional regulator